MAVSFAPQNRNKDNLNIDILIFFKGKRFKRTSGESVPAVYWNSKQQKCVESRDKYLKGISINKVFKKQCEAAEKACNYFTENLIIPEKEVFFAKMDEYLYGISRVRDDFIAYAHGYINERKEVRAQSTIKTYGSILRVIEQIHPYGLKFTDIDKNFYNKLQGYLYSGGSRGENYSNNYFGRIVKFMRIVFNDAKKNNIHNLPDLNGFKVEDKEADTIYLTIDELQSIFDVELCNPTEILVRAKFLLGANTGLRVSDFNNLDALNFSDRFITKTTQKTGRKIIVPISPMARAILDSADVSLPISDQKINIHIKEIARKAGITQPVVISKYIGGRRVEQVHEKCELVRSHTARRSFATNSFKAGIPSISIMKITGHTTEKSFLRYIRISEEENAESLLDHPFFK